MGKLRTSASVAVVAATLAAASACAGSTEDEVRSHLKDTYELASESGEYAKYRSDQPAATVAADIASAATPGRQHTDDDATNHYLGYEDVMVHVEQVSNGSEIEVTDPQDGYDRWGTTIVPIWGTFSGSYRQSFSGGGSGTGGK